MKAIYSPFSDDGFNEYLYSYIKDRLKRRSFLFEGKYKVDEKSDTGEETTEVEYSPDDVINSLSRKNNVIYFSNRNLINHVVYDLSQTFWYDELKNINNLIYRLNMEYRQKHG